MMKCHYWLHTQIYSYAYNYTTHIRSLHSQCATHTLSCAKYHNSQLLYALAVFRITTVITLTHTFARIYITPLFFYTTHAYTQNCYHIYNNSLEHTTRSCFMQMLLRSRSGVYLCFRKLYLLYHSLKSSFTIITAIHWDHPNDYTSLHTHT